MAAEFQHKIDSTNIASLQIVPPWIRARLLPVDDGDGLWSCVNRICDQYMPQLIDPWYSAS